MSDPFPSEVSTALAALFAQVSQLARPSWVEVALPLLNGHCVTSSQLEAYIRQAASVRSPVLNLRGLNVELKRVDASAGTIHVVYGLSA